MSLGYSKNKSIQILISLLKNHGIDKVIISPGTTNLEFTAGLQYDKGFELYSSIDERSAAYMACGMVSENDEPVVITCTEATASRNYFPGITEAYYRKLPILVVTGVHRYSQIGHLHPQIIDRSVSPSDMFKMKVHLPIIKDDEDVWETELLINKAILELKRGKGPVHIDLPCCNDDYDFSTKELPIVKKINRFTYGDVLPLLPNGKIAIFIGSHNKFDEKAVLEIDMFCKNFDSVVFCDHTSGYKGRYAIHAALLSAQKCKYEIFENISLLIHMGEPTGDGATMNQLKNVSQVWRVNLDGELRDTFKKITAIFEMSEINFFKEYNEKVEERKKEEYFQICESYVQRVASQKINVPFSNVFVASVIAPELPLNSVIHFGVSNTIRAWSMFEIPQSVWAYSNVGCRGIDGALSALIGGALLKPDQLHFCVLGDLSFFYDMNALGNRSIGKNLRIILINNNGGGVFKHETAPGHKFFGDEITNQYIAAGGHYGNKSKSLVKHYAEDLGFKYISASNKEEFLNVYKEIFESNKECDSIIFEIFTDDYAERVAFNLIGSIEEQNSDKAKKIAKQLLGDKGTDAIRKVFKRR